mmetsp:Transcript_12125/g.36142  ORF Transcript_12125/g.36142 Transcript_12125/m.36142 type:complete len:212 (+) Transcript_12125:496-1131(+)
MQSWSNQMVGSRLCFALKSARQRCSACHFLSASSDQLCETNASTLPNWAWAQTVSAGAVPGTAEGPGSAALLLPSAAGGASETSDRLARGKVDGHTPGTGAGEAGSDVSRSPPGELGTLLSTETASMGAVLRPAETHDLEEKRDCTGWTSWRRRRDRREGSLGLTCSRWCRSRRSRGTQRKEAMARRIVSSGLRLPPRRQASAAAAVADSV